MKNIETNKYFAIMSEKDDVELMRIITVERADYQADAVIAAEEELERREISPSMYQDFTEEVEKLIKVESGKTASSFVNMGESDGIYFSLSVVFHHRISAYIIRLSNTW